ncbi:hypothetical protein [Flavobacterium orientale]|uniref:Lipoprotein n=1 Tax=Flavobacterium orientale TaxID=1756020 RepID=A0A917DEP0_9FLAO|nr:hypothetical protein [Flavobacterium orientale]GGD30748.1 hypothetical protein GCM10011343_21120 [Flavobacterium orientale]
MKPIKLFGCIVLSLFLLNSCSSDDGPSCPQTETITMKINGEPMEFQMSGRGIDLDNDGSGHTLSLYLSNGTFSPQNSYSITVKLPYKRKGTNILEEFIYTRIQNTTVTEGDFVAGTLLSKVNVNTKNCISMTFSGSLIIDGNEVVITDGKIEHVYNDSFED